MKRILFVFTCLLAVILAVSCVSKGGMSAPTNDGRSVDSGMPQFVRNAVRNAPENTLIGVGTAKMATLSLSRNISETRARVRISRQMDTIVQDMVRDYQAGSEVDHSAVMAFQQNITVTLSRSRLQGASIIEEDMDTAGNYWTVIALSKGGVVQEINQAVAAAKLAVPAMASFNAEERMNQAFDRYYGTAEVGYSDRD